MKNKLGREWRKKKRKVVSKKRKNKISKKTPKELIKKNEKKIKKRKKPVPLSFKSKQILLLKITEWEKKTGITKDKFAYRIWRNEVKMRAMRQVPEYQERERIRSKKRWNKKNLQ